MVSHVRSTLNQVELVKVYLVCQNAMVGIVVFSIIAWRQQKLVFFMCRHYYTVLCNTLLQKILCFCRRGPSFEEKKNIFYFLPLQGSSCYHSLDEVNCARRFKFRRLFLACFTPCCSFSSLSVRSVGCVKLYMILIQVIVCVELCNCVIKNEIKH